MKRLLATSAALAFAAAAAASAQSAEAQAPDNARAVSGRCAADSYVTAAPAGREPYACDSAVVALIDGSRYLVQFGDRARKDSVIGFAGFVRDDGVTVDVTGVYLKTGERLTAKGICLFAFEDRHLATITCRSTAEQAGKTTEAAVKFTADPGQ